jgi:hypothetical protein
MKIRQGRGQQAFTPRRRGGGYNNHDKRNIQCYSCNQFWHYSTECRRKAPLEVREQANYVECRSTSGEGYTLFMKNCHLTIKDYNGRLIAYVKMSKNRMFPLNI